MNAKGVVSQLYRLQRTGPGADALVDDDWSLLIAVAWIALEEKLKALKPIEWKPKPYKVNQSGKPEFRHRKITTAVEEEESEEEES